MEEGATYPLYTLAMPFSRSRSIWSIDVLDGKPSSVALDVECDSGRRGAIGGRGRGGVTTTSGRGESNGSVSPCTSSARETFSISAYPPDKAGQERTEPSPTRHLLLAAHTAIASLLYPLCSVSQLEGVDLPTGQRDIKGRRVNFEGKNRQKGRGVNLLDGVGDSSKDPSVVGVGHGQSSAKVDGCPWLV